jgi:hypothetical protein
MAERDDKIRVDDELERLYGEPFERFVAERDAIAKRLKADDRASEAAEVRKLSKPSRAAWAINQAVRADPPAAAQLIDAGSALDAAQAEALAGGGQAELREAMARQQGAIERVVESVERGSGSPPSRAIVDRVRETLRAVAGDRELERAFALGRVVGDHEAVGFGAGTAVAPSRRAQPEPGGRDPGREQSAAKRRTAQKQIRRASRDLEASLKRVREAKRRVEAAEEGLDSAQQRLAEAEREHAAGGKRLADAEAELERLSAE